MRWRPVGFLALVIAQVLWGCGKNLEDGLSGPGGFGTGVLSVRLTDGPALYDAVTIVVDSVRVHSSSGDTLSGWYTISRGRAQYDLLTYINGKDTVVAEGSLPPGTYTRMRLYIGGGSTVTAGGLTHPLNIPGGSQSGFKLNFETSVLSGATSDLALDVDASRSIVAAGSGQYILSPVIKVIVTAQSGSLSGVVIPDTVGTTVLAIADTDTSITRTAARGNFTFKYLYPGVYLLRCIPGDTMYQSKDVPNVLVAAGQTTDIGAAILQIR